MKSAAARVAAFLAAMQVPVTGAHAGVPGTPAAPDLVSAGHDFRGNAQCVFKVLPNLKLTDGSEHYAELTLPARGSGMGQTYLTVRFFQNVSGPQWRGLGATSSISILNPAFETARPAWATVLIDGVPSPAGAVLNWDTGNRARLEVRPSPQAASQRLGELGGAMVATVNILDPRQQVISTHIFDVAAMRQVPDFLAAAGWKCPAAQQQAPVPARASTPSPALSPARQSAPPAANPDALERLGAMLDAVHNSANPRGGRFRYEGSSPCYTRYRLELDAGTVEGVLEPASTDHYGIDWRNIAEAHKDPGPPEYITLTDTAGTITSIRVPAAQRDVALGLVRELIERCAAPSPSRPVTAPPQATAPQAPRAAATQAPAASAAQSGSQPALPPLDPRWHRVEGGTINLPTCTLDGLPMLTVTQNQSMRLEFEAGQRSVSGARQTEPGHRFIIQYFLVSAGLTPDRPMFVADLPGQDDHGVADIRVFLDGVRFPTVLDTNSYGSDGARHFLAVVRDEDQLRFAQQFAQAHAMQWQLVSSDGRIVYEANFDLGMLGAIEQAIGQSQLRCPAS